MTLINHESTYNVKAVVRETGLKPDTLRAWERRYGLPNPHRTEGGHRLYSRRDIDILKWLVARQHEGLSISRAVDLWRKLETEPDDPLVFRAGSMPSPAAITTALTEDQEMAKLREAWISACLVFGELGAERILADALALYPLETVCTELLQAGLADIGQRWHTGKVSAQQEHFAASVALRKLEEMVANCSPSTQPAKILIGCPPQEEHTFGPLMLALFLCRQGWETVFLGANVSTARLRATTAAVKPNLVILAAQQLPTVANLLDMGQALSKAGIPMAFGGSIFNRVPMLQEYLPGYFLGEQLAQAVQWVADNAGQATSPVPREATRRASQSYQEALAHYLDKQGLIETEVWQAFRSSDMDLMPNYMAYANKNLARNVIGALRLGNLDFLDPDAFWVDEMLGRYRFSAELLPRHLTIYHLAARNHLDDRGRLLVDHLAQMALELSQR